MNAKILTAEVPVVHTVRPEVGLEYLTVETPDGWSDVKKISRRVLEYQGRKFTFSGWNSDRGQAYFSRPIGSDADTAKIL
jgi:hypothetical protein